MKTYIVLHGSVTAGGKHFKQGEKVELEDEKAADIDPKLIQPIEVWEAHEKGRLATEAALKEIADKAEAAKAKYLADAKAKKPEEKK